MAACNFLQPRGAQELKGYDTQSEVSESNSGWTSSWDSREDLRDFVAKIGLKDVNDLYQERFRVDRKKLEQMLSGDNEAPMPADIFFEQIMDDTNTFITWPSKLKVGAKSKKDPHVRIAGRPEDVRAAKERIMTVLDTRCNRVTMKMDVSYTDHSHIIGKGGLSIKRVMEETQCHVHFPDSNRSNPIEKSNQVSIAGDIRGVELARSRVRQKTPVVFGFELPIMSQNVDPTCSYIMNIQEQYNVQVMLRTRPKLHAILVLVKGVEWEVDQVKRATMLLVEFLCENLANQIPIQMSMEISPHHQPTVLGKNHSNLKDIMRNTGAQIMFSDAQDPNIPSLKKSNVTITGNIHNVYAARQVLIGSLPLLVMFDLPENSSGLPTRPEQIAELQTKYDVQINIRLKAKQSTMACIVKGTERSASDIYKARNEILAIGDEAISADIPITYHLQTQCSVELPTPTPVNPQPMSSPMLSPLISPMWHYPTFPQSQAPFVGMLSQQPQFVFNSLPQSLGTNLQQSLQQSLGNNLQQTLGSNLQQSLGSSGYHSLQSSLSLEQSRDNSSYSPSTISSINSSTASPLSSPRNPSPYQRSRADSSLDKMEISSMLSDMNLASGYHGPNSEKHQERASYSSHVSEFDEKRIAGFKAMQNRPTGQGYRYPNNSWAGYGISHTTSAPLNEKHQTATNNNKEEDIWTTKDYRTEGSASVGLNSSNYMDHTPTDVLRRITSTKWPDLATLLTSLGLEKYIGLLSTHEIDLTTFSSITDSDLLEIGVTALGARRKMLLAISELNKREKGFTFSPAPGAERKSSSSSTMSNCSPQKW